LKGTAGANPECNNKVAHITTTTRTSTTWDLKITSAKCSTVITGDFTFAKGSCTSASGDINIPGVGSLPDTINKTSGSVHTPGQAPTSLMSGLR
jgi:hypothetical protein